VAKQHPWGPVLVRVPLGTWRWDELFQQVHYFPERARRPRLTLYLRLRENTEVGALRAIIRETSPRRGGKPEA
jgi:hypothetical protein